MVKNRVFTVAGGDLRQAHLANTLASRENGYKIYAMFLENEIKLSSRITTSEDIKLVLPQSDVIIFPLPLLDSSGFVNTPLYDGKIELEECLDYILPGTTILAGRVSEAAEDACRSRGLEIFDYLEREEFAVLNAVATAEGAVEIAMRELPVTLYGSTCVVTGYGRISKALARLLHAFGAEVYVVARKYGDLAWVQSLGYRAVHLSDMSDCLSEADVLFNTVPSMILGEDKLAKLKRSCLVIDLASRPGGVDFEAAGELGLKTIHALSLPGKVAPVTAGKITLDTIRNILSERGTL